MLKYLPPLPNRQILKLIVSNCIVKAIPLYIYIFVLNKREKWENRNLSIFYVIV